MGFKKKRDPHPFLPEEVEINFKNKFISVSRIKKYEECPFAFSMQYVIPALRKQGIVDPPDAREIAMKLDTDAGAANEFGSLMHDALEHYMKWVEAEEYEGKIEYEKLKEFFERAWNSGEYNCSGMNLFQEGLDLLRSFARQNRYVSHFSILGVEKEFKIRIGEYTVLGALDFVEKVDNETVRVIDYKSNWMKFDQKYLDEDLQMSIYYIVARTLYPWAKRVELKFYMLRHLDPWQESVRNDDQIDTIKSYMVATARASENGKDYPPRLNKNCGYCDHREVCPSYQKAVAGKLPIVTEQPRDDLAAMALEMAAISNQAKALYKRRDEIQDQLMKDLPSHGNELQVEDETGKKVTFKVGTGYPKKRIPGFELLPLLEQIGATKEEIGEVLVGDSERLDGLLKRLSRRVDEGKVVFLQARLKGITTEEADPAIVWK